jgi:hypothetical protein
MKETLKQEEKKKEKKKRKPSIPVAKKNKST